MGIIVVLLTIGLALLFTVMLLKHRISFKNNCNQDYSWLQIFWIFDLEPIRIYRKLSRENKSAFWSVVSSTIVTIITFWLGLSVQYIVVGTAKDENAKLAHYQIIDKIQPIFQTLTESCSFALDTIAYYSLNKDIEKYETINEKDFENLNPETFRALVTKFRKSKQLGSLNILKFYDNEKNIDSILKIGVRCVELSADYINYLDVREAKKIREYNCKILLANIGFKKLYNVPNVDSLNFIKETARLLSSTKYSKYISPNEGSLKMSASLYSLFRVYNNLSKDKDAKFEAKIMMIQSLVIIPMIGNLSVLQSELQSLEKPMNYRSFSVLILLICIIVGYFIFRIVILKAFPKNEKEMDGTGDNFMTKEVSNLETGTESKNDVTNAVEQMKMLDRIEQLEEQNKKLNNENEILKSENETLMKRTDIPYKPNE